MHVFVCLVYQLPILIVSPDCLVRVRGHALIVVLARVPSQLVCDGVASPVVFGNLTVILILLRLMSWDPFYVHGFSTLATIAFSQNCHRSPSGLLIHRVGLWLLSLILLKPLTSAWLSIAIVMGLGAYVAMMAAVSSMRVVLLMEELMVCCLFVTLPLYLDVVQRVSGRVSVNVGDANPSVGNDCSICKCTGLLWVVQLSLCIFEGS